MGVDVCAIRGRLRTVELSIEPSDLRVPPGRLGVRKTVGKPTNPLVHVGNQEHNGYGHQHDDEQTHRPGEAAGPGVAEVVDRNHEVHLRNVTPQCVSTRSRIPANRSDSGSGLSTSDRTSSK